MHSPVLLGGEDELSALTGVPRGKLENLEQKCYLGNGG